MRAVAVLLCAVSGVSGLIAPFTSPRLRSVAEATRASTVRAHPPPYRPRTSPAPSAGAINPALQCRGALALPRCLRQMRRGGGRGPGSLRRHSPTQTMNHTTRPLTAMAAINDRALPSP
eukprot:scaffold30376_cov109-Isochrysis_galbana.AAC.3